ncbi:MAG TPA: DUF2865 domain-containing protein [Xanthobacteraceae bacterium]|nr:DUF2865 domain-containing protein [Xanthobacteraceae bacterium]
MLKSRCNSHLATGLRAAFVSVWGGCAIAAFPAPAAAEGLFDIFFGGVQRPAPSQTVSAYADPQAQAPPAKPADGAPRVESGPAVSYCVRLCDGRFFPIQRNAATPVEICNAFCPAARTKIFAGSSIEHAVAHDGSRYTDLGSAFAYRTKVVPGCTCNGKDAFGLVNMKAADDPTLRQGDVVATDDGFVAYSGSQKRGSNFTPVASATNLSPDTRRQLAQTPIRSTSEGAGAAKYDNATPAGRDSSDRQAQLTR